MDRITASESEMSQTVAQDVLAARGGEPGERYLIRVESERLGIPEEAALSERERVGGFRRGSPIVNETPESGVSAVTSAPQNRYR